MKTHQIPRRPISAAFTLIELLIVIVIIAILASVAFPVTGMVMDSARKTEARNELKNLTGAISMYRMEYGKLPFKPGDGGEDLEFITDDDNIVAILSGYDIDGLNPREKVFYEGKRAKGIDTETPVGGTYDTGEELKLADPWGKPYYIKIDSNYDKTIEELPGMEDEELRKDVAAWSESKPKKDGEPLPEEKWLKSWE